MISDYEVGQIDFGEHISKLDNVPRFSTRRPTEDKLYSPSYQHVGGYYSRCNQCDAQYMIARLVRGEARPGKSFRFHRGTIASGGAVIQDGEVRDLISGE